MQTTCTCCKTLADYKNHYTYASKRMSNVFIYKPSCVIKKHRYIKLIPKKILKIIIWQNNFQISLPSTLKVST